MRDKIKRRTLSSFYVKIQGKMGHSFLSKIFFKCCGKKNFEKLAKAHHLNIRETMKFEADYKELRKVYKKMNKGSGISKGIGMFVVPNFKKIRDHEIKSTRAIEIILGGLKEG